MLLRSFWNTSSSRRDHMMAYWSRVSGSKANLGMSWCPAECPWDSDNPQQYFESTFKKGAQVKKYKQLKIVMHKNKKIKTVEHTKTACGSDDCTDQKKCGGGGMNLNIYIYIYIYIFLWKIKFWFEWLSELYEEWSTTISVQLSADYETMEITAECSYHN